MNSKATVGIRAATFADADAISQLQKRNGMGDLDQAAWRSQWEAYPFETEFRDIPIGWVLETDQGSVVGNLDNIHTLYQMGERRLKGVVAANWTVDADYRGKSLQLMTTFFRQKGVDLWLNVSASPAAAQILTAFKIARIPIPDYGTPCFWAVRPRAFAYAALRRRGTPAANILAWPAGLALATCDLFRGSGRGRLTSHVRRLPSFDDRFDPFLQANGVATRLRAARNRAVLEWRFRSEFRRGRAAILAAEQGPTLLGYAILVRRDGSEYGMDLFDVADLQATADDPSTIRDLLLGSIKVAREEGADAVKFMSGTPSKRGPAVSLAPNTYQSPLWQQYFRTSSPELAAELSSANAWDFSRFDIF